MCKKALRFSLVNISSCDELFLWVTVLFTIPHSLCSHHFPPLHQRYCFIPVSQSIMDGFGFLTMNPKFRPLFQTGQFELLKNERGQSSEHEQEKDYANIFQTDKQVELYNSSYLSPWLCVFVVENQSITSLPTDKAQPSLMFMMEYLILSKFPPSLSNTCIYNWTCNGLK